MAAESSSLWEALGALWTAQMLMVVLLSLSILLTVFLGGCIALRNRDRFIHPVLKYASIAVLFAVIVVAGFAVNTLFDSWIGLAGPFVVLVFLPLAVLGVYVQQRSQLTPVNLLWSIALIWGPSFIIGMLVFTILSTWIGITLGFGRTNLTEGLLLLALLLGGGTIVAGGVRLSSWVSSLVVGHPD